MNRSTVFATVAPFVAAFVVLVASRSHAGHTALPNSVPGLDERVAGVTVDGAAFVRSPSYRAPGSVAKVAAKSAHHDAVAMGAAETDQQHVARLMSAPVEIVSCAGCTARREGESFSGRVSRLSPDSYGGRNAPSMPVYGSDNVIRTAALPY